MNYDTLRVTAEDILHRARLHILLIILLSLLAYSNTFNSSFHFDDEAAIVNNPIIKDLSYFITPSKAETFKGIFHYDVLRNRYITLLSFALNYRVHRLNVAGYHLINLFIHISTAILLYSFILLSFKTPYLQNSSIRNYSRHIAVFTALLFATHPIQTQAVTYIWQRATSLVSMFYLLSLVMYIKYRLQTKRWYYLASLVLAILAMKTKEIAFMLPVSIVLYEFIFFKGTLQRRILYLIPLILTMLIIPLTLIDITKPLGELIGDASEATVGASTLTRWQYLMTSLRVVVTYIRLLFLPVNQNLDYDYPVYNSFLNIDVFLSFVFLVMIFGLNVYIFFRYRDSLPPIRLISFGVIWFFMNLSLESSIIPLNNVIFEHRLYLPSMGIFLAVCTFFFVLIEKFKDNFKVYKTVVSAFVVVVVVVVLTGASYTRNMVWKDEITLWEDVVSKSPKKVRGYNNLGNAYLSDNFTEKAIKQYKTAIELDWNHANAHNNLGKAYQSLGLLDMAVKEYKIAIELNPDLSSAYNNLGYALKEKGFIDEAIEYYQQAIRLDPLLIKAHYNLGYAYKSKGLIEKAIKHYQIAIKLDNTIPEIHNNLGNAYRSNGLIDKAIEEYKIAIKLAPPYSEPHINLGNSYFSKGLIDMAIEEYKIAIKINPQIAEAYYNLAVAYEAKGLKETAGKYYKIAKELRHLSEKD